MSKEKATWGSENLLYPAVTTEMEFIKEWQQQAQATGHLGSSIVRSKLVQRGERRKQRRCNILNWRGQEDVLHLAPVYFYTRWPVQIIENKFSSVSSSRLSFFSPKYVEENYTLENFFANKVLIDVSTFTPCKGKIRCGCPYMQLFWADGQAARLVSWLAYFSR